MKKVFLGLILGAVMCSTASEERGVTVYQIKVNYDNPSWSFFRSMPFNTTNQNEQGMAYVFDASTDAGKGILSLLLTAKSTGNKVRVSCDGPTAFGCSYNVSGWGTILRGLSLE